MGRTLSIVAFVFAFIFPLVGLVLGIIAVVQAKKDPNALKGLAIAAIIIGGLFTLLVIAALFFVTLFYVGIASPNVNALSKPALTIAAPFSSKDVSIDSAHDAITFTLVNYGDEPITIEKIQLTNCDLTGINTLLASGDERTFTTSCEPLKETITKEMKITYATGTSTLKVTVLGFLRARI